MYKREIALYHTVPQQDSMDAVHSERIKTVDPHVSGAALSIFNEIVHEVKSELGATIETLKGQLQSQQDIIQAQQTTIETLKGQLQSQQDIIRGQQDIIQSQQTTIETLMARIQALEARLDQSISEGPAPLRIDTAQAAAQPGPRSGVKVRCGFWPFASCEAFTEVNKSICGLFRPLGHGLRRAFKHFSKSQKTITPEPSPTPASVSPSPPKARTI